MYLNSILRMFPAIVLLLVFAGCTSSLGPRSIPIARYQYNEAIGRSQDEQMLLNLVRIRYMDSPIFLDLDSIVASYSVGTDLSLYPSLSVYAGEVTKSIGSESRILGWSDSPTITYMPLKGEDFANRIMSPIKPEMILLLNQSGWGIERLFVCCVQQMNDLPNVQHIDPPRDASSFGFLDAWVEKFRQFQKSVSLLRSLHENGTIQLTPTRDGGSGVLVVPGPITPDADGQTRLKELAELLGLDQNLDTYLLKKQEATRKPTEIQIRGRSLLGVMSFLAQAVEVPDTHQRDGSVANLMQIKGKPVDLSVINRGYFKVRSSDQEPTNVRLKVVYRDHWFWIENNDTDSKGTFALLTQIFNLQAVSGQNLAPVLTLPTSK